MLVGGGVTVEPNPEVLEHMARELESTARRLRIQAQRLRWLLHGDGPDVDPDNLPVCNCHPPMSGTHRERVHAETCPANGARAYRVTV